MCWQHALKKNEDHTENINAICIACEDEKQVQLASLIFKKLVVKILTY